jgi:hypothetical protein
MSGWKRTCTNTQGEKGNRRMGEPNEKNNQPASETANEKNGNKVRKRETMYETTHRKAKKKSKRDPDQRNRKKRKCK